MLRSNSVFVTLLLVSAALVVAMPLDTGVAHAQTPTQWIGTLRIFGTAYGVITYDDAIPFTFSVASDGTISGGGSGAAVTYATVLCPGATDFDVAFTVSGTENPDGSAQLTLTLTTTEVSEPSCSTSTGATRTFTIPVTLENDFVQFYPLSEVAGAVGSFGQTGGFTISLWGADQPVASVSCRPPSPVVVGARVVCVGVAANLQYSLSQIGGILSEGAGVATWGQTANLSPAKTTKETTGATSTTTTSTSSTATTTTTTTSTSSAHHHRCKTYETRINKGIVTVQVVCVASFRVLSGGPASVYFQYAASNNPTVLSF
ncbi:MAG: hypothetical protein M1587_03180 [Thaumarchaeota archaeon]|nr:hypothetical protein [Nitrososphaerota archaeon]